MMLHIERIHGPKHPDDDPVFLINIQ